MWEGERYSREGWNGRPNAVLMENDKDEGRPWSTVCGWVNGIPGTWSRASVLRTLEGYGSVVACHIRFSQDRGRAGQYAGVGFVQYRTPVELERAIQGCKGRRQMGKGKNPKTDQWEKIYRCISISLRGNLIS